MIDVNAVLRRAGYGSHPEFIAIISEAVSHARTIPENLEDYEEIASRLILNHIEIVHGAPPTGVCMLPEPVHLEIFGGDLIEQSAIDQMNIALSMPSSIYGALMPDAHLGYSLPIGGVYVSDKTVFPGFVGYDISCMMKLTGLWLGRLSDLDKTSLTHVVESLKSSTHFGKNAPPFIRDHDVMYDQRWGSTQLLRGLQHHAQVQLGTSGSGNHFANLVEVEITDEMYSPYPTGTIITALMTHSGSRGAGHRVATHYIKQAEQHVAEIGNGNIPKGYGWLELDSELGLEYLEAMALMGDYAEANHQVIHDTFQQAIGLEGDSPLLSESNKHNYAWVVNNGLAVVHRKGATPAARGQIGIIPGSSGTPSFIVRGLGNVLSFNSAAHGAGRVGSRTAAKQAYDQQAMSDHYLNEGIMAINIGQDETKHAYKNIYDVMAAQADCVEPVAIMHNKVTVMDSDPDARFEYLD